MRAIKSPPLRIDSRGAVGEVGDEELLEEEAALLDGAVARHAEEGEGVVSSATRMCRV